MAMRRHSHTLTIHTLKRSFLIPLQLLVFPLFGQVPIIDYGFQAVPPSVHVNKVVELPDGKILVGGSFMNYAGSGKNHLVRLNNDGTVDTTWNPGGAGPNHQVQDIAVMPDDRIVIAGNFVTYNGMSAYFITRLQPNGDRDFTFNIPANAINGAVRAIDIQRDDHVVAVGEFFVCYGHSMPHIARFLPDGAVDLDFDLGTGFNDIANDVAVLPDTRILVGGQFSAYNGNLCGRLALLTPDGPYDTGMVNNPGFSGTMTEVRKVLPLPGGQVLVGGSFAQYNGQETGSLARVELNGTLDPTFTSPFYPFAGLRAIALHPDGHIFAGGEFTGGMYVPNVPGPARLIRLQPDGTRDDAAYDVGEGPGPGSQATSYVNDVFIQADGKVLVGGYFGSFHNPDETQYRNLIRLHPETTTAIAEHGANAALQLLTDLSSGEHFLVHPFPDALRSILRIHAANGQLVQERVLATSGGIPFPVAEGLDPGVYLVSVEDNGRRVTGRLVSGVW